MAGHALHTLLIAHGGHFALDAQGKLTVTPAPLAQQYRAAIQTQLCYLLVAAATTEARRLLAAQELTFTAVRPMVPLTALNAACLTGDVEATRREAVAYVAAWRQWLQGAAT